jgi:hypothetical protein
MREAWLTRRDRIDCNAATLARNSLKSCAYQCAAKNKKAGGTMTGHKSALARAARIETARDLLIVSTFGFWAFLLGLAPVIAIHLLGG